MECFLSEKYQRVFLNGQSYEWTSIKAGVPQGSILGLLLFLIYINDISKSSTLNVKLFIDDTSVFSTVYNINISTSNLNSDLQKVSERLLNGKCLLIQILLNKHKKSFFLEN